MEYRPVMHHTITPMFHNTSKIILVLISIFAVFVKIQAQPIDSCLSNKNAVKYFNGFQHTKSDPAKINTALYYAQSLARECPATLQFLFHTFFAQEFLQGYKEKHSNANERKLLELFINDTNQVLAQTAKPIYLWVQVQENENNPDALIKLANSFLETQLNESDLHPNRTARYALLICKVLENKKECTQVAELLFNKTSTILSNTIHQYDLPGDNSHNYKRAWYRYLYATIHFLEAENAKRKGDLENAEKLYRIAAEYSPDRTDNRMKHAYIYESVFLWGTTDQDSFKEEYIDFLTSNANSSQALPSLTALALEKPEYLSRLQSFYNEYFSNKEPFEKYWKKQLNQYLKPAPDFVLKQINNHSFSTVEQKGKWILVDFWGTWCEPCIEEMPKMQNFYREVTAKHSDKLTIITIACKDTEMQINTFMNKHKYNFPVAMAYDSVETKYEITAYPTKLLITPQGTILPINSGEDWIKQVKLYCQMQ